MRPLRRSLIAALSPTGVTPASAENFRGLGVLLHGKRKQKPLDGDVAIAGFLGDLLGLIDDFRQLRRDIELPRAGARDFRHLGQGLLDARQRIFRPAAGPRDQPGRQSLAIVEQHFEKMLRHQPLMAFAKSQRLRGLKETFGTVGEFFEIHRCLDDCGALPRILQNRSRDLLIYGNLRAQEKDLAPDNGRANDCLARTLSHQRDGAASRYPMPALTAGEGMPLDRAYAIENGGKRFDAQNPKWLPKTNFLQLMQHERLASLDARLRRSHPCADPVPGRTAGRARGRCKPSLAGK